MDIIQLTGKREDDTLYINFGIFENNENSGSMSYDRKYHIYPLSRMSEGDMTVEKSNLIALHVQGTALPFIVREDQGTFVNRGRLLLDGKTTYYVRRDLSNVKERSSIQPANYGIYKKPVFSIERHDDKKEKSQSHELTLLATDYGMSDWSVAGYANNPVNAMEEFRSELSNQIAKFEETLFELRKIEKDPWSYVKERGGE